MLGPHLEITDVVCSFLLPVEGAFVGIFLEEMAVKCFYLLQQHNVCWTRWQCELICDRKFLSFSWRHGYALYELKNQKKRSLFLKSNISKPCNLISVLFMLLCIPWAPCSWSHSHGTNNALGPSPFRHLSALCKTALGQLGRGSVDKMLKHQGRLKQRQERWQQVERMWKVHNISLLMQQVSNKILCKGELCLLPGGDTDT